MTTDEPTTIDETPTTVTSAPTTPVEPPAARGASRNRWIAAIAVSAVVIAAAIGATLLLTGEAPDADVLAWTPAESVMYAEARLDLPGDQRQQLGTFLSAFPGFDDQAILDQKLAEVMDRVVRGATEGAWDYQNDIDPWFDGQVSVSVGPLPTDPDDARTGRLLVLVGVDDAAAARAWVDEVLASEGAPRSTTTHGSVEVTVIETGSERAPDAAYATFGPVLALGDLASVTASIDTGGNGGLASADTFTAASRSLPGDRLAYYWMDLAAVTSWSTAMQGQLGPDVPAPMPPLPAFFDDMTPAWVAGALRAEGDALVFEARSPHVAAIAGDPANRASTLAALVPANTLLLAASHDVSGNVDRLLTLLRSDPNIASSVTEVENALGILGGVDGLAGWIGDLGIVVVPEGSGVAGGVVIDPTDRAAAERLLTTLRSFVTLAGGSAGISIRDETHGSAAITILTIEDASQLLELARAMGSTDVPSAATPPITVELAWSVTDDVVVLGSSPSFVRTVLDVPGAESLAENDRFEALVGRAGREHSGLFWVDVAAARGLAEGILPAEDRADYDREIRPYVEALDAVLGTQVMGSDVDASSIYVTVSE